MFVRAPRLPQTIPERVFDGFWAAAGGIINTAHRRRRKYTRGKTITLHLVGGVNEVKYELNVNTPISNTHTRIKKQSESEPNCRGLRITKRARITVVSRVQRAHLPRGPALPTSRRTISKCKCARYQPEKKPLSMIGIIFSVQCARARSEP